jgi:hypothetical protein
MKEVSSRIKSVDLSYWVFGHFPSSGILENRKHNVSFQGAQLSTCLPHQLRAETDPVSET